MENKISFKDTKKNKLEKNGLKSDRAVDYVIIGNSAAGLSAAENIRGFDRIGHIVVLTSESYLNYSKPLITYYIAGKVSLDKIYFREKDFYTRTNIDLRLNSEVNFIDTDKKKIIINNSDELYFNKLLIASGGKPIIPKIRVIKDNSQKQANNEAKDKNLDGRSQNLKNLNNKQKQNNNLGYINTNGNHNYANYIDFKNYSSIEGIFTLTTLDDAIRIKNYIDENNITQVSILGGGLIGLKSAEALLEMGLEINVIELSDRILSATFDIEASNIIQDKIKDKNSNIFTNNTVEEIYIRDRKKICGFKLRDGRKINCRLLIIAIGVRPNIGFLGSSKIEVNRGILVNNYMETTQNNIFAAGDVVESSDLLLGENRNIAIWPLAVRQGAVAGVNMSGRKKEYSGGFFMNSVEILGIPSISIGLTNLDGPTEQDIEVLKDFKPEKDLYKKIVIRKDRIVGAILVGNIERAGIYAGLIKNKIDISNIKENILREDFGIIQLPREYRKHLVVGEGIEV